MSDEAFENQPGLIESTRAMLEQAFGANPFTAAQVRQMQGPIIREHLDQLCHHGHVRKLNSAIYVLNRK